MATYTVNEGDSLATIAFRHRVSEQSLLDANGSLKGSRGERLEVLKAGDVVVLPPPPELRIVECATGGSHAFTCMTWTRKLRVRLLRDGKPLGNAAYSLEVGTVNASEEFVPDRSVATSFAQSDGAGWVEEGVPVPATYVRLGIPAEGLWYVLCLDTIHPLDELSGVVRRLQLLGYYRGRNLDPPGDLDSALVRSRSGEDREAVLASARDRDEIQEALGCFQRTHRLEATERVDGATKAKLKELAGI